MTPEVKWDRKRPVPPTTTPTIGPTTAGFRKNPASPRQANAKWVVKDELGGVNNEWFDCKVNHAEHGACEYADFWSSPERQPKDRHHPNVDCAALRKLKEEVANQS